MAKIPEQRDAAIKKALNDGPDTRTSAVPEASTSKVLGYRTSLSADTRTSDFEAPDYSTSKVPDTRAANVPDTRISEDDYEARRRWRLEREEEAHRPFKKMESLRQSVPRLEPKQKIRSIMMRRMDVGDIQEADVPDNFGALWRQASPSQQEALLNDTEFMGLVLREHGIAAPGQHYRAIEENYLARIAVQKALAGEPWKPWDGFEENR